MSNLVFTGIFTAEAIVKLVALRQHYFKKAWNVFDFIIVVSSVIGNTQILYFLTSLITPSLVYENQAQWSQLYLN